MQPFGCLRASKDDRRSPARRIVRTMASDLDPRAAGARRLTDKVCIVTGAGQGIGRATARRLGQEGGKIVVADRVDKSATQTVNELHANGVDATKAIVDLS